MARARLDYDDFEDDDFEMDDIEMDEIENRNAFERLMDDDSDEESILSNESTYFSSEEAVVEDVEKIPESHRLALSPRTSVCAIYCYYTTGGMLGSAILKDDNPLPLHYVMFIPTIVGQGIIEQQGNWISRAWSCSINIVQRKKIQMAISKWKMERYWETLTDQRAGAVAVAADCPSVPRDSLVPVYAKGRTCVWTCVEVTGIGGRVGERG
ncbi:hypothetical protein DMN91_001374 [Ooceraea biroi]|uniref:Acyl-coenzyme A oxidase N-terminal domain-containing protein n=1 Tax=Ooceraea biroi TaxID=2015173 RepID=A0A3L8E4B1_OOCBI|nr:hypothetical protein DMN91_001374 [Ooceraea biroi]